MKPTFHFTPRSQQTSAGVHIALRFTSRCYHYAFVGASVVALACIDEDPQTSKLPTPTDAGVDADVSDSSSHQNDIDASLGPVLCGPFSTPSQACADCATQSCCDESTTCAENIDCRELVHCLQRCSLADASTQACADGCSQAYNKAVSILQNLDQCTKSHCSTSCTTQETGGISGVFLQMGRCMGDTSCGKPQCQDCNSNTTDYCETDIYQSETNCGGCGITCAPNQFCAEGYCTDTNVVPSGTVLSNNANGAFRLVAAKGYVYWSSYDGAAQSVRRVKSTGENEVNLTPDGDTNGYIAADETYFYHAKTTGVVKFEHGSQTEQLLYSQSGGCAGLEGFGGAAYIKSLSSGAGTQWVRVAQLNTPEFVFGSDSTAVTIDQSGFYLVAVGAGFTNTLFKVVGSTNTELATNLITNDIGASTSKIVALMLDGTITSIDKTTKTQTVIANDAATDGRISVVDDWVYYCTPSQAPLYRAYLKRVRSSGGNAQPLAQVERCVDIAASPTLVFWINAPALSGSSTIRSLTLPTP